MSDLTKYISGAEEFGVSYYEPISLFYLEEAKIVSKLLGHEGYLSFQSSFIILFFILFKARDVCFYLKSFWMITLGFVIPLINVRYASIFPILLFLPGFLLKYIAPLCHWNLIVLLFPTKLRQWGWFFLLSIPLLLSLLYAGSLDFVLLKIEYYFKYGEKDYGFGLFFEIFSLLYMYVVLYRKVNASLILILLLLSFALFSAFLGLPVISSRLVVLTFLVSLLELYRFEIVNLRLDVKIIMAIVALYEVYRIFKMIGYSYEV